MKNNNKRFTALVLSSAMALSLGVTASAATGDLYSVSTGNQQVLFSKGGVTTGTFNTKEVNPSITLTSNAKGELLIGFVSDAGKSVRVTLGDQDTVTLGGVMTALTIDKNLNKAIAPTVDSDASVGKLTVAAPNTVAINGAVTSLEVSAAANVTIASTATVTKKNVTNKNAKVTTSQNTNVTATAPTTAAKATTPAKTNPTTSTTTASGTVKLTVKQIYTGESDVTLDDLLGDLASAVTARDSVTKDQIDGECTWNLSDSTSISSDRSVSFTFTPDDSSYAAVKGMVTINVDKASGDVTLKGADEGLSFGSEDDKLKDYTKALNRTIYAEDSDGKDVEGKCTWNSGSSTKVKEGESFQFTFTPSNSRYNKATGRITIG